MTSTCTSVQHAYSDFRNSFISPDVTQVSDHNLLSLYLFTIDKFTLAFHMLNSAWMSRLHERQGQLYYPAHILNKLQYPHHPPDLVITMFHHPYNWFESNNSRAIRSSIESTSDIVMTGHEHDGLQYTRRYPSGDHIEYLEGGVLQDILTPNSSSFNALIVDLENKQYTQFQFDLNMDENLYFPKMLGVNQFLRNKKRLRSGFEINDKFDQVLRDPGARYTHPFKENIVLDDLFIYPDLRELQLSGPRKKSDGIIRSSEVPSFISNQRRLLILGSDKAGKSILAHRLFRDFYKKRKDTGVNTRRSTNIV